MNNNFSNLSSENRLRIFIDNLFISAPNCDKTLEMKCEILQNLTDKYSDLINEGKTEDEAFNISIGGLGDITPLIDNLIGYNQEIVEESYIDELKRQSAFVISICVTIYLASPVPIIFFRGKLGIIGTIVMVAVATGMICYNKITSPQILLEHKINKKNDQRRQRIRNFKKNKPALEGILWISVTIFYFVISFLTRAWYITWIIFLFMSMVSIVIENIDE